LVEKFNWAIRKGSTLNYKIQFGDVSEMFSLTPLFFGTDIGCFIQAKAFYMVVGSWGHEPIRALLIGSCGHGIEGEGN